jgi:hypothetical protein
VCGSFLTVVPTGKQYNMLIKVLDID